MARMLFFVFTMQCLMMSSTSAEIVKKEIDYTHDSEPLKGEMYWDDSLSGVRPGVIVVHEWWGLNDYAKSRAKQLAEMGYVAFAIDMYGAGKTTKHPDQAGEWMKINTSNVERWRDRALIALDILKKSEHVDKAKLAAIGYCFGGATVMQMAYSEIDLNGVVSFHGSLPSPDPMLDEGDIKTKILVVHGNADPFVSKEQVSQFKTAIEGLKADMQFVSYAGVKHSFTNPGADAVGMDGLKYNADADRRSWQQMQMFFEEIFADQ